MVGDESKDVPSAVGQPLFATTHWSVILAAGQQDRPQSAAALEELCGAYWYPLYVFIRRKGHSPEDAEDLTQAFFERLIKKDYVKLADPQRGKFRSFLLVALKNFLANEWARSTRQKRGGGCVCVNWDVREAEDRYSMDPADELTPETLFDRQWAITLLERVLARLTQEQMDAGREHFFREVKGWLWGENSSLGYAEVSARLGMSEPALKSAVHRLRLRYRELLREEIGRTVATPIDVPNELADLMAALRP